MGKIVVALGGNALGNTVDEQIENSKIAARSISDLIEEGHQVVIAHGNGPQVGIISKLMNTNGFQMPLVECSAMSQGYIGYHLTQCIKNELQSRKIERNVCTILTQVMVDENDPAFQNATKPIGNYYIKEEAIRLMEETGKKYVDDSGRGWRLVVPSPKPVDICEKEIIKMLVDSGVVTIACGGGGIPVLSFKDSTTGIEAVIDKDFAAAKLAELINADYLFILTAVDQVKINFNKPDEKSLVNITIAEAKQYITEGHFAPGSMLPKIEAALSFVEYAPNKKSIIGSLQKASEAINGKSGTTLQS
ncbi:MAG: carbamate kinase [Erysipelothrix sp.]|nr:carbamate kinase [Erysipelothrix sp.]